MKKGAEERKEKARQEFQDIIVSYILPLFDVRGSLKCISKDAVNSELICCNSKGYDHWGRYI